MCMGGWGGSGDLCAREGEGGVVICVHERVGVVICVHGRMGWGW